MRGREGEEEHNVRPHDGEVLAITHTVRGAALERDMCVRVRSMCAVRRATGRERGDDSTHDAGEAVCDTRGV